MTQNLIYHINYDKLLWMEKDMEVTDCEAFLTAIDHGSLTAAGVFLGYT
ncbi:hypothetical protein QMP25_38550 [Enterocloster clostridioformis]